MTIDNSISKVLEDLAIYFKADRVILAEIHAETYIDLEAYNKVFSVTYEYLQDGIFSVKDIIRNIPISILEKEQPYYNNNLLVVNQNNPSLPPRCLNHLKNIESKTIINCLLRFNTTITGILSIQFKDSNFFSISDLSEQDINVLIFTAQTLSKYI